MSKLTITKDGVPVDQKFTIAHLKYLLDSGTYRDDDEIIVHDIVKKQSIKIRGFMTYCDDENKIKIPKLSLTAEFDKVIDEKGSETIEKDQETD